LDWKKILMWLRSLDCGYVLSKQYKNLSLNCHRKTDVPNGFFF
jgi:hypothetical protein